MIRPLCGLLLCALLSACATTAPAPTPAPAPQVAPLALTGTLEGAPYRIEAPANWNGDLVMYLHGYEPQGTPRRATQEQDDFDRWLLGKGYAVARSAYSSQGWAVAEAMPDNERLRVEAVARLKPRRTFLVGHSLGAHLALASLERHPDHYDGALALCGVNLSADEIVTRGGLDVLAAFDYFFPGAMGLPAGGLADPEAPPFIDPAAFEAALQGNEGKAQLLVKRTAILREDLAGALMLQYLVLREITARAGGFPVDNRQTVYSGFGDDAAFNAGVRRYQGDTKAMAYLAANAHLSGSAPKPVVVLSNHDDPTVPVHFTGRYAELATAAGRADYVLSLPLAGKGHCAFAPEDTGMALDALAKWIESGKRP